MMETAYVTHLRGRPQFGDEIAESSIISDSLEANAEGDNRGRSSDRRDMNAKAQAALGYGRGPTKKRSASESWATRPAIAFDDG